MFQFFILFALSIIAFAFFAAPAFAQTKALDTAQTQLATFANASEFSLAYDETRYVTIATVTADSISDNESFKKQLKKFEWTLSSYFAVKGIDTRPVRVVLCADTQAKKFLFQRDSDLTVTFDGEDVLLGEAQRTSEFKSGKTKENLCWEVDKVITEDFAKATKASFAIAGFRGTFSAASLAKFRDYGSLVTVENK
jgi:hypothetical protein